MVIIVGTLVVLALIVLGAVALEVRVWLDAREARELFSSGGSE